VGLSIAFDGMKKVTDKRFLVIESVALSVHEGGLDSREERLGCACREFHSVP